MFFKVKYLVSVSTDPMQRMTIDRSETQKCLGNVMHCILSIGSESSEVNKHAKVRSTDECAVLHCGEEFRGAL